MRSVVLISFGLVLAGCGPMGTIEEVDELKGQLYRDRAEGKPDSQNVELFVEASDSFAGRLDVPVLQRHLVQLRAAEELGESPEAKRRFLALVFAAPPTGGDEDVGLVAAGWMIHMEPDTKDALIGRMLEMPAYRAFSARE